jgi:hypothetical protein
MLDGEHAGRLDRGLQSAGKTQAQDLDLLAIEHANPQIRPASHSAAVLRSMVYCGDLGNVTAVTVTF